MKINNFDYTTMFLYISKQFSYKRINWMPHTLQPIALDHVFEAATIYSPKFKIFVDLQKQNHNSSRLLPLQIAMALSAAFRERLEHMERTRNQRLSLLQVTSQALISLNRVRLQKKKKKKSISKDLKFLNFVKNFPGFSAAKQIAAKCY